MDSNISEYSYYATSIDDYFTEVYNLEFNQQIVKELTDSSLSIIINEKKLKFTENNHLNEGQKKLKFTPISFFNLFYHELDFIISNKSKPLHIIPHLSEIKLTIFEQLYFYEKLSIILLDNQNEKFLSFIGNIINMEYIKIWDSFFGRNLITDQLISNLERESIYEHIETLTKTDELLAFLLKTKYYLIGRNLCSSSDKDFLREISLIFDYYKEMEEIKIPPIQNSYNPSIIIEPVYVFNPVFKEDNFDELLKIIKDYFPKDQFEQLEVILKTGKNPNGKLTFLSNGNKLLDFFKRIYKIDISGCQKNDLEKWIFDNFQYRKGNVFVDFSPKTINNLISGHNVICKNPIFE